MEKSSATPDKRLILLAPDDNVLVALAPITKGEHIEVAGVTFTSSASINIGHKLARNAISPGEKVLKYGISIGSATEQIEPGDHIHLHNLKSDYTATHSLNSDNNLHLVGNPEDVA